MNCICSLGLRRMCITYFICALLNFHFKLTTVLWSILCHISFNCVSPRYVNPKQLLWFGLHNDWEKIPPYITYFKWIIALVSVGKMKSTCCDIMHWAPYQYLVRLFYCKISWKPWNWCYDLKSVWKWWATRQQCWRDACHTWDRTSQRKNLATSRYLWDLMLIFLIV